MWKLGIIAKSGETSTIWGVFQILIGEEDDWPPIVQPDLCAARAFFVIEGILVVQAHSVFAKHVTRSLKLSAEFPGEFPAELILSDFVSTRLKIYLHRYASVRKRQLLPS